MMIWSLPRKIGVVLGIMGAFLSFSAALERATHIENILEGISDVLALTILGFICCLVFLFSIPTPKDVKT